MRVLWIGLVGVRARNHWVILLLIRRTSLEHFQGIEEVDATVENFDSRNIENCVHCANTSIVQIVYEVPSICG